jgi:formamidopyrimidine-DNA glycosylase
MIARAVVLGRLVQAKTPRARYHVAMPELPEVETIVRHYRPRLEGRRITRFRSRWAKQAEPSVAAVRRGIVGKRIRRLWRRAKFIVADLDGQRGPAHLLVHLRMSGRFEWAADHVHEPAHVRTLFDLDDGNALWLCDSRKFGKVIYTTDLDAATAHLGIEPLERTFTAGAFETLLRGRARQLKPLLLDQSLVAGLGNIYVDETLFRAGLHPMTRSDELTPVQIQRLRREIRAVLRKAIHHHGTTFDAVYPNGGMKRYLKVYGRTGLPCPRCRTPIDALRVAQRGTHLCPKCQPLNGKRRTRSPARQYQPYVHP